jgi:hypothetical protein
MPPGHFLSPGGGQEYPGPIINVGANDNCAVGAKGPTVWPGPQLFISFRRLIRLMDLDSNQDWMIDPG